MKNIDDNRKEFERWAARAQRIPIKTIRDARGVVDSYIYSDFHFAWLAWNEAKKREEKK